MNLRKMLQQKTGKEDGFTLVELLVVIVILGVLSAVVVFSVSGISDRGHESACESNVKAVQVASEAYRAMPGNAYAADLTVLQGANLLRDIPGTLASDNMSFTTDGYTVTYGGVAGNGSVSGTC